MKERTYRFFLGTSLLAILYLKLEVLEYVYVGLLLWEGITGYRMTLAISRWRYGAGFVEQKREPGTYRFSFEAERGMRLWFAAFMIATFYGLPADFWFVNWLVAISLFLSGLVNYCPMVGTLRWVGFR